MNRHLRIAAAVLASGAIVIGTAGCFGGDSTPATTTVETEAPAPTTTQAPTTVTEQTTVTDQNQNNNNQNNNNQNQGQAEGEAIGRAEEGAGLSEARKECLANAPSAADCANIP